MNDDNFHYSFIDESGTTSPFSGSIFFVALFDTWNPHKIELHVRRLHKRFGTSLKSGEMKASESQVKTIRLFLSTIARKQVEIITTARKKETEIGFPGYIEKAETVAIGRALGMCGYGTLQAPEFDEGDLIADSPVVNQSKKK